MARGVRVAAVIVGLHTAANLGHGVPHAAVPVELATGQRAFVVAIVLTAPLFALGLLWRGRNRTGASLLVASMAASLLFGLYHHFAVPNPDHVHSVLVGPWRDAFRTTAVLVAVVDAVGVVAGLRIWIQVSASSST